jgi:hypothetical protein
MSLSPISFAKPTKRGKRDLLGSLSGFQNIFKTLSPCRFQFGIEGEREPRANPPC